MILGLVVGCVLAASAPAPVSSSAPKSVYRLEPLFDDAAIAVGSLTVVGAYAFSSHLIHETCPCDPNEVNAFDHIAIGLQSETANTISDITVALSWTAPIVLDLFDVGIGRELLEDMVVYAEALAVNAALVTIAKYSVERPLPIVYAGLAPELISVPGGYRSFYSGHTSNAVTALMVASMTWTLRHGNRVWPWLVTAGVGVSVGVERVLAGRHFPSDVIVGMASGVVVGYVIPKLHERTGATVAITSTDHGAQVSLAWRW